MVAVVTDAWRDGIGCEMIWKDGVIQFMQSDTTIHPPIKKVVNASASQGTDEDRQLLFLIIFYVCFYKSQVTCLHMSWYDDFLSRSKGVSQWLF